MKNEADQSGLTFFAPHLTVRNVLAELNFCKAAFGALELRRFSNPDGSVHVAEMSIGGALFHIHEEMPGSAEMSPETLKGTSSAKERDGSSIGCPIAQNSNLLAARGRFYR
ncbi:MAG TPA: hypothetical protein VFC44_14585 [Candidatus Saccharimonadales bacterium]|jgi:uncharacterized glyoxalase superfamily protein PhnB|nr:hypothetical protein [Candidatus Saccharimonadales bacterium]